MLPEITQNTDNWSNYYSTPIPKLDDRRIVVNPI